MTKLPEGYRIITSQKSDRWDYEKEPLIEGLVIRAAVVKDGRRVVDLRLDDGRICSVWQTAALKAAFDEIFRLGEGRCRAAFLYRGTRQLPGKRIPMHDIIAGVKPLE